MIYAYIHLYSSTYIISWQKLVHKSISFSGNYKAQHSHILCYIVIVIVFYHLVSVLYFPILFYIGGLLSSVATKICLKERNVLSAIAGRKEIFFNVIYVISVSLSTIISCIKHVIIFVSDECHIYCIIVEECNSYTIVYVNVCCRDDWQLRRSNMIVGFFNPIC